MKEYVDLGMRPMSYALLKRIAERTGRTLVVIYIDEGGWPTRDAPTGEEC